MADVAAGCAAGSASQTSARSATDCPAPDRASHWQTVAATIATAAAFQDRMAQKLAEYGSLGAVLERRAASHPHDLAITWLDERGAETVNLTFRELHRRAARVVARLQREPGLSQGDRVVLLYPPGPEFDVGFWGCALAGIVAVPVYPPTPGNLKKDLPKLAHVCSDAGITIALSVKQLRVAAKMSAMSPSVRWPKLKWIDTDRLDGDYDYVQRTSVSLDGLAYFDGGYDYVQRTSVSLDDLSYFQYTSGSTSDPKGVMITERNVLAQLHLFKTAHLLALIGRADLAIVDDEEPIKVAVSWLPQYHDFGLIFRLMGVFWNFHIIGFSPISFIKDPAMWPLTISKYKARMSPSPDFGFSLAARKIKPDQLATLDLSSWHIAQSGAEPIRLLSMKQFFSKFEPVGFKQESFAPSYGLAEHVLGVQGGYAETMPTLAVQVDKSILRDEKRASIVESGSGAVTIFHVGTTLPQTGVVLLIVDSNTMEPQPDGRVGEIWINSLSKGAGYWRKPESTVEIFEATLADSTGCSSTKFLRTGDLGFKIDRKLYICGRAKDVIIIAGRNYYPNDLEESIDTVGSAVLRPGCAAAFSVQDDTTGAELLVIAIELRDKKGDQNEAISVVQSAVRALHSISVDVVVLLHPRTIPKTTSGKIQRQRCKAAYLDGALSEVSRSSNMLLSSGSSTVVVPTLDTIQWTVADLVDASVVRAKVARAIQEKLKDHLRLTETVDLSSSMVDLGVSSIGMTHLHEDFMQMFGVDSELLPLEVLFEDRSVHDIAVGIAQLVQNECDRREQVHSVSADNQTSSKPSVVESRLMFHLAQTAGSMLILFVGSAALIPAYYFGEAVLYDGLVREPWSMIALWGGTTSNSGADAPSPAVYTFGLLVPFLIPIWIMAFTLAIVLLKWCCVGRYKAGDVPLYSAAHLRWWLIDQLLEFWETWVGYFLSGLFYLNIFYKILGGSKIDASAKISAFLREPDLVSIGAGSSISGRLYTRRFGRSVLHFDRIVVGARCTIKSQSVLTPGCCVGDDTVLEALSAVARGAALDEKSVYSGNPAVRHQDRDAVDDTTESTCNRGRWTRVASKVLIQVCVLVVAFSLSVVSVLFWEAAGIPSFRYGPLLYWVVSFFFSSGTIAICSPIVKWLLIGRVKPGCYDKTLCRDLREWTVNYVYSVATYTFMRPWPSSPVSQFWQKAHGVKIANQALVLHSGCISASEADLVILDDHTFLSACTICCNRDDADGRVVRGSIHLQHGSMVGLFARVGLGPDQESCTLEKGCAVGVLTNFQGGKLAEHQAVFGSITMAHRPNKLAYPSRTSVFFANCAGFLFRLRVIMVHVLALIPAYEFAVACFFGSASEYADTYRAKQFEDVPMPRIVAVMLIAVAYLIYVVVLVFASVLYKRAIFGTRSPGSIKVDRYHDLVKYLEYQALVYMMDPHYSIIRGTMLLNYVFKAFGARIGNGVQIYGRVYEHEMHTIGDDVVLDSCTFLLGHVGQDMGVTFAATCLESGARVEPGAVVWGGDTMSENSVLRSNSKMAAGASLVRGGEYIGVPASRSTGTGTGGRGVWGPPRTSGSNETLSTDLEIQEAPESANVAKSKASTIELSDDKVKLVSIKMQPMTSMGLSWHRGSSMDDDSEAKQFRP